MSIPKPEAEADAPAEVILTRIDPAQWDIRIHYAPDTPGTIAEWQTRTAAAAVINAGFFLEDDTSAGLIIAEGVPYGYSFDTIDAAGYDSIGMLTISDGLVAIRDLLEAPYTSGEAHDYAVQGLPMLVHQGAAATISLPDREARRTAVALDSSGRLIFLTIANDAVSLYALRDWLTTTPELAIVEALGLDGGQSTGLVVSTGTLSLTHNSWAPVPSVVAIYPRTSP